MQRGWECEERGRGQVLVNGPKRLSRKCCEPSGVDMNENLFLR